ncbi:MAG: DUF362 domain-containing protein [Chloroflexota bacterium]|nr:DUF362 domain-containing protein [Chloroflexota bacterium]
MSTSTSTSRVRESVQSAVAAPPRIHAVTTLPPLARIRQKLSPEHLDDVPGAIRAGIAALGDMPQIKPGAKIAVTGGSRGVADIVPILRTVVEELKARGAEPFLIPAMGSHGGATADGQIEMMAGYGMTEAALGCPVRATMEVVELGTTADGITVYYDRMASEADGVIVVNRVKAHTAFRGEVESGVAKMIAVGMGKRHGAEQMHSVGLGTHITDAAAIAIERANIVAGIHIVENAYEQVHTVRVSRPDQIIATDAELLKLANTLLPRVPFNQLDVLIVDTMGKNISGTGMDPNIIGMWRRFGGPKVPDFTRIVILNLTPETHGNAMGIGFADFTTRRVFDQIDHHALMMNAITAEAIAAGKIPLIRENDEDAIAWAIRSALRGVEREPRIARIHSTLHLDTLAVSPALLDEVRANDTLELVGELEPPHADESGHLVGMLDAAH